MNKLLLNSIILLLLINLFSCNRSERQYTLNLTVKPNNAGTTIGGGSYKAGDEIKLSVTPTSGFTFTNWTEGTKIISENTDFTYTIPSRDVTLSANFTKRGIITLQPNAEEGKDTWIYDLRPNNGYGNHTDIAAMTWTNNGTVTKVRGLIQFDFSAVPENATIDSVKLTLYGYHSPSNGSHSRTGDSNTSTLQRITQKWDEYTVTWNNQPKSTNIGEVVFPESTSETQNYILDVTESAKFMIENPSQNFGYILKLTTEECYRSLVFASSDNKNNSIHPRMDIYYSIK